jgi:hypothetical protein|tara:strand:- start:446 stop:835 length:390 start_codon:yes stop_codon:yes gene_type:complete
VEVTTQQQSRVPENWQGSDASFIAYESLVRQGKQPGIDFSYNPPTQGRRMDMDVEVDFLFSNPSDLAIQVQESFYAHQSGISTQSRDILNKVRLAGFGKTLVLLDHDQLMQDPDWLISEALQYRDHSRG